MPASASACVCLCVRACVRVCLQRLQAPSVVCLRYSLAVVKLADFGVRCGVVLSDVCFAEGGDPLEQSGSERRRKLPVRTRQLIAFYAAAVYFNLFFICFYLTLIGG